MELKFSVKKTPFGWVRIAVSDGQSERIEYLPFVVTSGGAFRTQELVWHDDRLGVRVRVRVYPSGEAVFLLDRAVEEAGCVAA
jgi:hypothetical protein